MTSTSSALRAERWAAAVLAVFGIAALVASRRLAFGTITQPGAGFVPVCLAAMLTIVAFALLVSALRGTGDAAATGFGGSRIGFARATLTLLALLAYAFLLEPIGFGPTTFVLIVVLVRVVEPQPWPIALGGAVATVVVTHVLFRVWLGVRLPVGPLGF